MLPTELRRLNLSGMENLQLTDHSEYALRHKAEIQLNLVVEIIVNRCTLLIEIDCSDCGDITGDSIEHFNRLNDLRKLSLCRCHSVEPISLG